MLRNRNAWILSLLCLSLLASAACNDASVDDVLGTSDLDGGEGNAAAAAVVQLQEGVNLSADPEKILLDPNDPNAPTDPNTGLLIGSAKIAAELLDADLEPIAGVDIAFATSGGTLSADTGTTNDEGLTSVELQVDEDDAGDIEVTATYETFAQMITVPVVLVPLNSPPVADAGMDQTFECPWVALDGSGSSDPDDDIVSYEWFIGDELIAEGETADVELPVGVHVVTLTVTDSYDATSSDDVTMTVVDTTAPVVTIEMSPDNLWPPNHKMRRVEAVLDIDDCDEAPTVTLLSVESNEAENANGDGNTEPDIEIIDETNLMLRAERAGGGSGRVYTVRYSVVDAAGNETFGMATVTVPHDQGH